MPDRPGRAVEILTEPDAWARWETEWRRLWSSGGRLGLHYDWLTLWWRLYGPLYAGGDGLRVIVIRDGDQLLAALPLYLARGPVGARVLRFLGTGERESEEICPGPLDLLAADDPGTTVLPDLAAAIRSDQAGRWHALRLGPLADGAALLRLDPAQLGRPLARVPCGSTWIADLSGGWEGYLARRSGHSRQRLKRMLRQLEAAGGVFETASDRATARAFYGELVELHQRRWTAAGRPGCFAAPRFAAFHEALVDRLEPGAELLLARLRVGDRTLATIYAFRSGARVDVYQLGVDHGDGPLASPGMTALAALFEWSASQGVMSVDLLPGEGEHKQRLAITSDIVTLCCHRSGLRGFLAHRLLT